MHFSEFLFGRLAEGVDASGAAKKVTTHISHLEDLIIDRGTDGATRAIEFIKVFLNDHHQHDSFVVTKKIDGAPAIVFGVDPTSKKFFVSTKSIFNKTPRVCFSERDIDEMFDAQAEGLINKLKTCYKFLKSIVKSGIYQGDLLYAAPSDLKHVKIDGNDLLTFRANTITYAVDPRSSYGKAITRSELGLVVHTSYTGEIGQLSPVYHVDLSVFKKDPNVFLIGNRVHDISEELHLDDHDKKAINGYIRAASTHLKNLSDEFLETMKNTPKLRTNIHRFVNQRVKNGDFVAATDEFVSSFKKWMTDDNIAATETFKKSANREASRKAHQELMDAAPDAQLRTLFAFMEQIAEAKKIIISKLTEISGMTSYINDGAWNKIPGEGLVIVDAIGHDIVKLVDRQTFSKANFNLPNEWRA